MLKKYLVLIYCALVQANIYNSSKIDLKKCKTHYSRSGSVYKDFYSILDSVDADNTLLLDFHFSVLAPSDAHVLLAPSDKVQKGDPAYEIVIGAGGNTFCDIRRKQKSDVKASVRIKGLLSALDPQSFWLHITKDGDISVGKEGDELPFISWVDPDPLPFKVISFSTWSGIEAKWFFDCQLKKETKEIEKPLTHLEKLRQDLLYHYDPYARPVKNVSTHTTVSMALDINRVTLDEHSSTIEVLAHSRLAWQDEKLTWDPKKYGGLEALHIFRREIWQPDLCLYNAVGDVRDLLEDTLMVVFYYGHVKWNPSLRMKAFCDGHDLGMWPKEKHRCNIDFGFMRDHDNLRLAFNGNESSLIHQMTSEWTSLDANVNYDPPIFKIIFTLQRSTTILSWLFFTPFLFLSVATLSVFWLDPFGKIKISLGCLQLVICTVVLLGLGMIVPKKSNTVPYLVCLYSYSSIAILVAIVIAIIVVNLARNHHEKSLPHLMSTILTSRVVRHCLCLPNVKMPDKYGDLNDDREKHQTMWILLGTSIDRLSFVVFCFLSIYAIILNNHDG